MKYEVKLIVNSRTFQHEFDEKLTVFDTKEFDVIEYIDEFGKFEQKDKHYVEFQNGHLIFKKLPIPLSIWKKILPCTNKKIALIEYFGGWPACEVGLGEIIEKHGSCTITKWTATKL